MLVDEIRLLYCCGFCSYCQVLQVEITVALQSEALCPSNYPKRIKLVFGICLPEPHIKTIIIVLENVFISL